MKRQDRAATECRDAIYLLGFSPRTSDQLRAAITSVLPMIECQSHGNVDGWFVRVPRDQFEGPDAEKNLADIRWLSPRVMAHQQAVEHLSRELPFYPAHFGTLFSDLSRLFELIDRNRRTLLEYFANDARHVEWGVKVFVAWSRAVDAFQQTGDASTGDTSGGGLNYLRRKKMIRQRDQAVRQWIDKTLAAVREEVQSLAVRCCDRPTNVGGDDGDWECIANLAVLVPWQRQSELQQWIESKHAAAADPKRMLSFQLTGPWPLYSFLPPLVTPARCDADEQNSPRSAA
jgi:hypothetical protein